MTETLCDAASAIAKAGANANATIVADTTQLTEWINQAESVINAVTEFDWVAIHGTLTASKVKILEDCCSSLVAMNIINYDMSGYTSRYEAEIMLDVLDSVSKRNMSILKASNKKDFVKAT